MGETVFPGNKSGDAIRIAAYASLVNGDLITIGNKIYEWRTSGSASGGHVQLDVKASDVLTAAELQAKITANPPTPLVDAYIDPTDTKVVRLEAHEHGTNGNVVFSASMTGGGNIISQASGFMLNGENGSLKHLDSGRYTVTALDVLATAIMIPTKLTSPKILSIQVFDATGLTKYVTTLWTPSSTRIKGVVAGGTNLAATDVVCWSARD